MSHSGLSSHEILEICIFKSANTQREIEKYKYTCIRNSSTVFTIVINQRKFIRVSVPWQHVDFAMDNNEFCTAETFINNKLDLDSFRLLESWAELIQYICAK